MMATDELDDAADKPPVASLTPTPTHPNPSRITMPAPETSAWAANANIAALRASEATNGAYSPSILASGASSPAPESGTPRGSSSRRPSRGATAAKLTGALAFKRMFGSGANTPAPAPTPPLATRSQSTETTQDSLMSKHPPPTPDSESETTSERFRSNPPSRAQSFSSEVRPSIRSRPPSVSGQSEGHKFNLKDLLASTPKPAVSRKSSTGGGSRKSDAGGSEYGGKPASVTSNGQLKHYGTCERVAIGKGATSIVKLAHKWDRTEEKLYAVKEFRKRRKNETEKEYVKKLTAEFCISSALHHINIVETVDLVKDENQHWCEVMEYCPGGDLYAAIKRGGMSPSEVECCFKQVLQGVEYLHSQGVAHRDIKPENLFFNQHGHLKIGDYGASTVYRLPWEKNIHMSTGLCGSEPYIAPEQFIHGPYDARLVDIWACGIVYYCLHFQELPWRVAQPSDPLFQTYVAACNAKPVASAGSNSPAPAQAALPSTISNLSPRACRPLLRKMLDPNPKLRAQIEDIMKDPWLVTVEVCTDTSKKPSHVHAHAQARAAQIIQ
ncbi:serine/threonine-protein kinase HAL4/sat4 [Ceratobasidium sp. 428]|nr:serine/threonine-protein kinase HAL4/sat4 [Ceratobasidium sp. 428]